MNSVLPDWEEHVRTFVRGRKALGEHMPHPKAWRKVVGVWGATELRCARCFGPLPRMVQLFRNDQLAIPACKDCEAEVWKVEHDVLKELR